MLELLRLISIPGAIMCVLFFLLAVKKKSDKPYRWLIIGAALVVLGVAVIIINNVRINGNKKALESSRVVTKALEDATPLLLSNDLSFKYQNEGQTIKEPYVLVPIDRDSKWQDGTKYYKIIDGDSCWSGGQFISAEQADQCKTVIFYETFVLEMPYQSTDGSKTTGKSESKSVYLYDVETASLFGYNRFGTHLPSITRGTPNLQVSTQTILDWIKEEMSK